MRHRAFAPPRSPDRRSRPATRLTRAAAVTLGLLAASVTAAQTAHPTLQGFETTTDYQLVLDGAIDEGATLRMSQTAAALLIVSEKLEGPILVWARSKRVDQLDPADLIARATGTVDLKDSLDRKYLGDFTNEKQDFVFPVPGRDARMRPTPPLLGQSTLTDLLGHSPSYRKGMDAYAPNASLLRQLAAKDGLEVKVFFGSWCGHCKNYLPLLLKVHESLGENAVAISYYGLDYPPDGWKDPEVDKHQVKGLPTAIVYQNGREVGRITGGQKFSQPEASLLELLR